MTAIEQRIERVLELSRQLDETEDNDKACDLIESITSEAAGLPGLLGYGLVEADGEVVCATLDLMQARRIQTLLLTKGVVTALTPGTYSLMDIVHPEVSTTKVVSRLVEQDC